MNQPIKLTLLVDNQACEGLVAEHGFALWIEADDQRILFDTGAGTALLPNAEALGIDLLQANALVLSHGHYDHTGGLANFLAANDHAQLYFGQALAVPRYSFHPGVPPRAIGITADNYQALLKLASGRTHELHAPLRLTKHIGITGPIPRRYGFEDTGGPFFLDNAKKQIDMISDDLAMWCETPQGLLVASGCCHAGLVNTVEYIRKITGIDRVHGIVGGLHLLNASAERLEKTLGFLHDWQADFLIPCHCTGTAAVDYLKNALGEERIWSAQAGKCFAMGGNQ